MNKIKTFSSPIIGVHNSSFGKVVICDRKMIYMMKINGENIEEERKWGFGVKINSFSSLESDATVSVSISLSNGSVIMFQITEKSYEIFQFYVFRDYCQQTTMINLNSFISYGDGNLINIMSVRGVSYDKWRCESVIERIEVEDRYILVYGIDNHCYKYKINNDIEIMKSTSLFEKYLVSSDSLFIKE